MAYRLHIQAYDATGKRLSLERLRRDLPGLIGPGGAGVAGTRLGAPGIWVERDGKAAIRQAVLIVRRFGENTGYQFRHSATNAPTQEAVADLVRVERG